MAREYMTKNRTILRSIPTGGIPRGPYAKDRKTFDPIVHDGGYRPLFYLNDQGYVYFDSDEEFSNVSKKNSYCANTCYPRILGQLERIASGKGDERTNQIDLGDASRCYSIISKYPEGSRMSYVKRTLEESKASMEDHDSIFGVILSKENSLLTGIYSDSIEEAIEIIHAQHVSLPMNVFTMIDNGCGSLFREFGFDVYYSSGKNIKFSGKERIHELMEFLSKTIE